MNRLTILTVWMLITVATITTTEAFSPSSTTTTTITRTNPTNPNPNPNTRTSSTSLAASSTDNDNSTKDRRAFLRNVASAAFGTAATVASNSQPASASYSAFANREKDWEDRSKSGGELLLYYCCVIVVLLSWVWFQIVCRYSIHDWLDLTWLLTFYHIISHNLTPHSFHYTPFHSHSHTQRKRSKPPRP